MSLKETSKSIKRNKPQPIHQASPGVKTTKLKTTSLISTLNLNLFSYYISVFQNYSTIIERSLISFLIEPKYDVKIEEE